MKVRLFTIFIVNKKYVAHDNFHSLNVAQSFQKVDHPRVKRPRRVWMITVRRPINPSTCRANDAVWFKSEFWGSQKL